MTPTASYGRTSAILKQDDPEAIESRWGLRRIVLQVVETQREGEAALSTPLLQIVAAAVVKNPWVGGSVGDELVHSPQWIAARLSKLLSDRLLDAAGGRDRIEAFGKGAIIGESGELEHGAAIMHSPYFASHLREFLGGTAVISFADTRGPVGETLVVPLCEKNTGIRRDHYQSIRVRVPDAPLPNEIVLVAAAATGPRPFPRVGDRSTDLPLDTSLMNGVFA